MKSNPLTDVLPAKVRKYVYAAYTLAVLVVGILALFGVEVDDKVTGVLAAVGGVLGATAASNVHRTPKE